MPASHFENRPIHSTHRTFEAADQASYDLQSNRMIISATKKRSYTACFPTHNFQRVVKACNTPGCGMEHLITGCHLRNAVTLTLSQDAHAENCPPPNAFNRFVAPPLVRVAVREAMAVDANFSVLQTPALW